MKLSSIAVKQNNCVERLIIVAGKTKSKNREDVILTYCIILDVEPCKPATRFKRSFKAVGNSAGIAGASVSTTKLGESVPLVERLWLPVDSSPALVTEGYGLHWIAAPYVVCADSDNQQKMAM